MKFLHKVPFLVSCLLLITISCSEQAKVKDNIEGFSWFQGQRVDSSIGFYETWSKPDSASLYGFGFQIVAGDTIFGESLSVEKIGEKWAYVVRIGKNKTVFNLVSSIGDSLVFENPENEFPKRITYLRKENGQISAIIENPGIKDKIARFNFTPYK